MPQKLSTMRNPDPFSLNEDSVNIAVATFFQKRGYSNITALSGRDPGIDVSANMGTLKFLVESKGSRANHHSEDTVFDNTQLPSHLGRQILQLMKYRKPREHQLLFMANPDIPRINSLVYPILDSLDELGFIRLWVNKNHSIRVDCPVKLVPLCQHVGIL